MRTPVSIALQDKQAQEQVLNKYTIGKSDNKLQLGKNPTTTFLWSESKKDQRKKLWVGKNISSNYSLINATCDVFFGQLATRLFSKTEAPKTKFNPQEQGIVSRVIDDGNVKYMNLSRFVLQNKAFITNEAIESLAQALCFKILIGDRDIALRNMIAQYSVICDRPDAIRAKKIYGIDYEYGLVTPVKTIDSLRELLPKLAQDPKVLTDILVRDSYNWNFHGSSSTSASIAITAPDVATVPHINQEIADYDEALVKWLATGMNQEAVINCLTETADAIAADNYKILYDIKEEIANQLIDADPVYSETEISKKIMPTVDWLIDNLKEHIQVIQDFAKPEDILAHTHKLAAH